MASYNSMLLKWSLCSIFLLVIVVDCGDGTVPTVTSDNGTEQIAVTPNSFDLSFTVTPSVLSSNIRWFEGSTDITDNPGIFRQLSNDRLTLTINPVTSQDEAIFRLEAINADGTGSGSVRVSVESEPGFQDIPKDVQIHELLNTTFICFATGVPTPDINWFFNGSRIIPDGIKHSIGAFGSDSFGSLTITNLEFADAGEYTCVANNTHGSNSVPATLEVQVFPVITVQPLSANVTAGSIDTITCTARGFPFTDIYWQKNGQSISDISEIAIYSQSVAPPNTIDLTVVGTLTITGPVLSTNGNFSCVATNFLVTFEEKFSNEVEIFVQYPPSTISVDQVTVNQTDPAAFNCSTFGIPPPTISWYSSLNPDTPIVNSGGVILLEYSSYINETGLIIRTSTLSVSATNRVMHEANYTCLATNGITNLIGTPEGGVTELIVQVPSSLRSLDNNDDLLGIVTDSITLSVIIDNASPDVQANNVIWQFRTFNSSMLQIVASDSQLTFSDNRRNLTISSLTHENEGFYIVTATNEAGIDSLELTLNIEAAPNITIFPADTNVLMNSNAQFNCGATSEPSHTVQWQKGGVNITDDNMKYNISQMDGEMDRENVSILTVLYTDMNDTADYTCIVRNIHGGQSHTAHLEVQVPPVLLNVRDNDTIIGIFSETANISCQYFGSPIPEILWFNDSLPVELSNPCISIDTSIKGFVRSSTLLFSSLNFFDDASYTCLGTNTLFDQQNTTSSNISLVINRPPLLVTVSGLTEIVNQSENHNITCSFLSRPIPDIVWISQAFLSSPSIAIEEDDKYNIYNTNDVQIDGVSILSTSILEIVNLNELDSLDYICTATNRPRGSLTQNESNSSVQSVIVQTSPIVTRLTNEIEIGVKTNEIILNFTITRDLPVVDPEEGIQWYHTNDDGVVQLIVNSSRHSFNESRTSLTITNLTLGDEGIYSLNASNIIGDDSDTVFLDVQRSPMIISSSGIVRQVFGLDAFLECIAVSEPVHISRWLFNGVELFDSVKFLIQGNGTTSSNLTVYNITSEDEGNYTCRVDNAHGADEESSQLLVQVPPLITQQPVDTAVLVTRTVSLVCCASGVPVPIISWFKESEQISNDNRTTVNQTDQCGMLTITNATLSDTNLYKCVANNTLATELSASSNTVDIVVQYPPEVFPLDQTVYIRNQSDEFVIECRVFGVPLPTVYWIPSPSKETLASPQEQLLSAQSVDEFLSSIVNFNGSRLIGAESQCVGSGMDSDSSSVSDDACTYDTDNINDCTLKGSLCSVPCVVNIDSDTSTVDSQGRSIIVSQLRICSLLKLDQLSYTCVAVNNITNVINTTEGAYTNLIVQVPPEVVSLEEEDPETAFRNRNVTLDFNISLASPDVIPDNIVWTFVPQRQDGEGLITIPSDNPHYEFSPDRRSLKIVQLKTNDTGLYTLIARNPAGIASESITLDVQALPDIVNFSSPMEVRNNDTITLSCFADGSPIQSVQWTVTDQVFGVPLYKIQYIIDNPVNRTGRIVYVPLVNDIDENFIREKFTIAPPDLSVTTRLYGQLTIKGITPFEAGEYNCTLNNKFGVESRTVTVEVQLNPSIVQTSVNMMCVMGISCQLFCLVEGVPSPDVTFWKDSNLVVAENNAIELFETVNNYTNKGLMLNVVETVLSTVGVYICRGANSLVSDETIESNPINLIVHSPATISDNLSDTVGNDTSFAILTCSVTGIPEPSITWFRNEFGQEISNSEKFNITTTSIIGEFNLVTVTSDLVISNLTMFDELSYSCVGQNGIENVIGANNVSTALLTVQIPPTVDSLDPAQEELNGTKIVISFNITRASPPVQLTDIQWSFVHINGTQITLDPACLLLAANCTDERYTRYNFSSDLQSLTINSASVTDYGVFSFAAANPAGISTQSSNLVVQVPAQLINSSGKIINLNENETLIMNCTADGIPRPTITWSFRSAIYDTNLLQFSSVENNNHAAFRSSVLTVPGENGYTSILTVIRITKTADEGEYVCRASTIGIDSIVSLTEPYRVTITEFTRDFCVGEPCQNGGTCSNGTNTFICACVETGDVKYGGSDCSEVSLANIRPTFTQQPRDSFTNLFSNIRLSCAADGQPSPTILWLKNGVSTGIVGNEFNIQGLRLEDRGNYSCFALNLNGNATSNQAIVNILDIVQYTANLTVLFNQVVGNNLTTAANAIIDTINIAALGQSVNSDDASNTTFFAINSLGAPLNNTRNITVPILLTIRTSSGQSNDELRQNVAEAVSTFGYELQINSQVTLFDRCPAEVTTLPSPDGNRELDIFLTWPETILGMTATINCPCNLSLGSFQLTASRTCGGNFETGADWNFPEDSFCDFSITARMMCQLANLGNVEVITRLPDLTKISLDLGGVEIALSSFLLDGAAGVAMGNMTLTETAVDTVDNTLGANRSSLEEGERMFRSQARLLAIVTDLTTSLPPDGELIMRDNLAIRSNRVTSGQEDIDTTALLPNIPLVTLQANLSEIMTKPNSSLTRSVTAFADDGLFIEQEGPANRTVITPVLDYTIVGMNVTNLTNPINITFNVNTSMDQDVRCVFWDPSLDSNGFGRWNTEGCITIRTETGSLTCRCDHLTSFSILLDVAAEQTPPPGEDLAFSTLTYIGISVSIVCILVTIFTYLYSAKLRKSEANQLLVNLCFALLGLYLTFFLAAQGSKISTFVCAIVGALLHYFLLVVFFVMAAEAIDLFIKLVIVLGSTIQHYITKAVIIAWILPLFIVPFTISPHYRNYVNDHYCGATGPALYVGVLVPFFVVYIFNNTIFFIIMGSLLKKSGAKNFGDAKRRNRKQETKQHCRVAFTISVLFGLGWGFGLLASQAISVPAIRIIFNTLFTVFIAFQGFFIFLLYIVLSPNAKKEWKRWILRKEDKGHTGSSVSGSSTRSKSTGVTGVKTSAASYKNYNKKRAGTLYHNVYTSHTKPKTSFGEELTSGAFDSEQPMMEELKYNVENDKTFMNPLDEYEDTFSMLSEQDTQSVNDVEVSAFPNPNPPSSLEDGFEASLTAEDEGRNVNCTTLDNPFLSVKGKQVSVDGDELELLSQDTASSSNRVFSFDLSGQYSESQGLSEGTFSDDRDLIKPSGY